MSDRCQFYRLQLSRNADEALPSVQTADLEAHLNVCASCRQAQEADQMLRQALREESRTLKLVDAVSFEQSILAELRRPEPKTTPDIFAPVHRLRVWWQQGTPTFVAQMAGGALAAAGVTLLYFMFSLNPARDTHRPPSMEKRDPSAVLSSHGEPPVRLESLTSSPTPRAASLWTKPKEQPQSPRPESAPAIRTPEKKSTGTSTPIPPREHGSLDIFNRLS